MEISAHLHTILQRHTPEGSRGRVKATLSAGSTVEDLIKHLEITLDSEDILLAVNGRIADLDQILKEDDHVNLMLPISGGTSSTLDKLKSNDIHMFHYQANKIHHIYRRSTCAH